MIFVVFVNKINIQKKWVNIQRSYEIVINEVSRISIWRAICDF